MTQRHSDRLRRAGSAAAGTSPEEIARKRAAIREGLGEIEDGKSIPLEDIEAWVESWDTPDELPRPEPRSRRAP